MSSLEIVNLHNTLQIASKRKHINEIEMITIRSKVLLLTEELTKVKEEVELTKYQIHEQCKEIQEAQKQYSIIKICKACDVTKIESHLLEINLYKKGFLDLFIKEKNIIDNHCKEEKQKIAAFQQEKKQQQMLLEQQRDMSLKEIITLEEEADVLTRECAVLKKRNTAIMLKLQRTLIEKEDARQSNKDKMTD